MTTDFCIVGFPKCGTSALSRFFERSDKINLIKKNDHYEAPYFNTKNNDIAQYYVKDKLNGHKFTAYAYTVSSLTNILEENPKTLIIFCVRDNMSALFSWHNMHRRIAEKGEPKTHFVNQTEEARNFHRTCTVEEYYYRFAEEKLEYPKFIKRVKVKWPDVRMAVVSQRRLASDARTVMARLHKRLGVDADSAYLDELPASHRSYGENAKQDIELDGKVRDALSANDKDLLDLIDSLAPEENLTTRQPVF